MMNIMLNADFVHSIASKVTWVLIDSSIKAAVLLAIATVINGLWRRGSAAIRDRIWTLAFCGAMFLPVISSIVPQWRIPIFRITPLASELVAPQTADTGPVDLTGLPQINSQRIDPMIEARDLMEIRSVRIDGAMATGELHTGSPANSEIPEPVQTTITVKHAMNLFDILFVIWTSGTVILLVPFAIAVVARRKLLGRNKPLADPVAKQLLEQTSIRLGLTSKVTLLQADEKTIPMTIGVLRSAIIVPSSWSTWPLERFRFVMLHELAHIRRHDILFQSIARIVCAFYWFNPLAWYALHRMRFDCELACDDQVIATGEPASAYASQLIEIARLYRPAQFAGGIAMARSSKLETRIVSMLDATRPHRPIDRISGRLIFSLSTGLILALSAITVDESKVVADEPDQPKAKTPDEKQADSPKALASDAEKAAAANSGRDDVNEAQTIIQHVLSIRNVQYANVGTQFAGSSKGGICFVAASSDVQKELELDDATSAKVRSIVLDYRMRRMGPSVALIRANRDLNSTSNLTRDEVKQKSQELLDKFTEDLKKVDDKIYEELIPQLRAALTEQQLARLQQIAWQAYGSHDLAIDPELTKAMELKADQVEKIAAINNEYLKKVAELHRERSFMVKHLELDKERDARAIEVLTTQQQTKYAKLEGKPFNLSLLSLPPAWQTTQSNPSTFDGAGIFRTTGNVGIFKVAENPAVQKELGITPEVEAKISNIKGQFAAAWRDAGGGVRPGFTMRNGTRQNVQDPVMPPLMIRSRDNSPEEREKTIAKMAQVWYATTAKFQPQLKDVLTPEQYTRLQQINWQTMGTAAFFDHDVIQALSITQQQQEKIAAIATEYRPQIQQSQVLQGSVVQGVNRGGPAATLTEVTHEQDSKINAVLTKEQLDSFAMMKGKPFQFPLGTSQAPNVLFEPGLRGGIYSIIRNETVQKELGLTRDAIATLNEIKEKFNRAWIAAGGGIRVRTVSRPGAGLVTFQEAMLQPWNGPPDGVEMSEDERTKAIEHRLNRWYSTLAQFQPELKAALTAEQFTRLQQIAWQAMGTAAFSEPDVIEALSITREQQKTIGSLVNEYRSKRMSKLREGDGSGGEGRDLNELIAKMRELSKQQDTKINDVLTKAQRDLFSMLKGPAFPVEQLLDEDQLPEDPNRKTAQSAAAARQTSVPNNSEPANGISLDGVGMIALIAMDAVLAELGIEKGSAEHMKIREVMRPFPTELSRRMNNPTEAERSKRLTARELYAEVESELVSELRQVLTPQQFSRLQQIHWQRQGIQALSDPDVATSLGITADQQRQLSAAKIDIEKQRNELINQRDEMRDKGQGVDELQKKIQDLEAARTQKYNDILTVQQRDKFAEIQGKRFDIPQPERPAFANRGRPIQTRSGGLMALAIREPVLKELGIEKDAAEVAELRELMVAHSTELQKQLRELRVPDREKAKEIESNLQTKFDPDLKKMLKPEQFERLKQIHWQQQGVDALESAEIITALDLTKEQREQLSAVNLDANQKRIRLLNPLGGRQPGRIDEQTQVKIKELGAEVETKVNQILTQAQQEKFAELKGRPFDLSLLRQQSAFGSRRNNE